MAEETPRIDEEIQRTWRSGEESGNTAVGLADPDTTDGDGTDGTDGDGTGGGDADGTDGGDSDGTDSAG